MFLRPQMLLFLLAISLVFCPCDATNEVEQRKSDPGRNVLRRAEMDTEMKKEIYPKICAMVRDGNVAGLEGILEEFKVELNKVFCLKRIFSRYEDVRGLIFLHNLALAYADNCISLDSLELSNYA